MRIPILIGAVAVLLAQSATAVAAPAWCKGGLQRDKPGYDLKSMFTETDPVDALRNIIGATCYSDGDTENYAKQIEAIRLAWSKKLALTEADWVDVNEWAHYPSNFRLSDDFFVKDRQAAWSTYTPLDQFALLNKDTGQIDNAYVADAFGAKLSMMGRIAYVSGCIERQKQDDGPVAFAMCATDAGQLDMAKAAAEIAADKKYDLHERIGARLAAYYTIEKIAQWKTDAEVFKKKDPAYEKMFELGEAAYKTWASVDAKVVQLASDMDDAEASGSRKASAGCMARAEAAWADAVKAVPIKKLAAIHSEPGNSFVQQLIPLVIASPNGYLAALSLNMCATLEKKEDALARIIGAALVRWPGFRGPRTGTQTAILTAGLQLDERDKEIDFPDLKRQFIRGDHNTSTTGPNAITGVKVEGDKATITFAKQKVTQQRCVKGHNTNRIQRINDFGQFVYEYVCDKEITETIDVSPSPPLKVVSKYAIGLKSGMSVTVVSDVVAVAYPKGSTTPSIVTGVEVK